MFLANAFRSFFCAQMNMIQEYEQLMAQEQRTLGRSGREGEKELINPSMPEWAYHRMMKFIFS